MVLDSAKELMQHFALVSGDARVELGWVAKCETEEAGDQDVQERGHTLSPHSAFSSYKDRMMQLAIHCLWYEEMVMILFPNSKP